MYVLDTLTIYEKNVSYLIHELENMYARYASNENFLRAEPDRPEKTYPIGSGIYLAVNSKSSCLILFFFAIFSFLASDRYETGNFANIFCHR